MKESKDLAVKQEQGVVVSVEETKISFDNAYTGNLNDAMAVHTAINEAKVMPVAANPETWNPISPEEKRLSFIGYAPMTFVSQFSNEEMTVNYVLFAEPVMDEKTGQPYLKIISTGRASIRTFFLNEKKDGSVSLKQAKQTLWLVKYLKSEPRNGKNIHQYDINPLQIG